MMRTYRYIARTSEGALARGVIPAEDENDAAVKIREKYEIVVSLKERRAFSLGRGKAELRAFVELCERMEALLSAGVKEEDALELLGGETRDRSLKRTLLLAQNEMSQGATLREALSAGAEGRLPEAFFEILRHGEETGETAAAFGKAKAFFERHTEQEEKKASALSYPFFVFLAVLIIFIVLMASVVPSFITIYQDLGKSAPRLIRVLFQISKVVRNIWPYVLLVIAVIAVFFVIFSRTEKGAVLLGRIRLALPMTGDAERNAAASRLLDTMSLFFEEGKTLSEAAVLAVPLMTNARVREELSAALIEVKEGEDYLEVFKTADFLPDSFVTIVGELKEEKHEETAKALSSAAEYYAGELARTTRKEISVLSVILILLILLIAGFTVIAIYFSMFGIYRAAM